MDYVKESALLLLLAQRRLRPEALKPCSLCIQRHDILLCHFIA